MPQNSDDGRPKTVSYAGKNYWVEQSPGGFALKITPEGTPVPIGVINMRTGRITALDPNNYDLVKGVYDAYKASGSGFAAPEAAAAGHAPSDVPTPNTPSPAERIIFPTAGGAIVKGTPFGDITYSGDGTEARTVQKSTNPVVGETTIELIARYIGGDNPGSGKGAGMVKGGAKVLFESMNPRAKGRINTRGNDEILVLQSTNGGKESEILGTGEKHVAQSQYTDRDLNAGNLTRGNGFLKSTYKGLKDAMDEATKRRAAGEKISFDPASTVAGQNALKEYARYESQSH
jgi:hypothetical protein